MDLQKKFCEYSPSFFSPSSLSSAKKIFSLITFYVGNVFVGLQFAKKWLSLHTDKELCMQKFSLKDKESTINDVTLFKTFWPLSLGHVLFFKSLFIFQNPWPSTLKIVTSFMDDDTQLIQFLIAECVLVAFLQG